MKTVPQCQLEFLHASIGSVIDTFAEASLVSAGDFALVEEAARIAILHMREVLMSSGLELSASRSKCTYHCPTCSAVLRAWSLEPRRVVTSEGEATYRPIRYRCLTCSKDHYPLEEANGLSRSQYTTGAKAVIAEVGAEKPYAHVSSALSKERGLSVSPKEVDRTMREVAGWRAQEEAQLGGAVYGPNAALLRAADADPLASAPALHGFAAWPQNAPALISVDGAMVRSTVKGIEGLDWFECRAGLIRSVGKDKRTVTFYTGGVKSPDEIFDQLGASWLKAIPPDCICVFVADGARWIWDRVRLYFPTAIQVLDFYHACEHIDSAAAAWHGAGTVNAAKWRNEAREKLLEPGGVRMVLREILEALRKPQNVANVDALRTQLRYIIQHRHRMRYFEIRSRGLPIGSGAMESGIKQLIPTRLRMPGMKWTKEGADAVLKVRSAHMSNSLRLTTTRRHTSLKKAVAEQYRAPLANAA